MPKNLAGNKYGYLTVCDSFEKRGPSIYWKCQCVCGKILHVFAGSLLRGASKSCGCRRGEKGLRHGKTKTYLYQVWKNMKARCQNPRHQSFKYYGARGIKVCVEWLDSFSKFAHDMGERPSPRHTLERKDNNEGYSKSNCCWETRDAQSNNRRCNRMFTFRGETMSLSRWCKKLSKTRSCLAWRLNNGWSVDRAFSE